MSEEELIEKLCLLPTSNPKSDERYTDVIYNYIINLQQENKQLKEDISWWSDRFKAVERDNRELKDKLSFWQEEQI